MSDPRLRIKLGNVVAYAELLKDAAPTTVDAVRRALPLRFPRLSHGRFSGEECGMPVPRLRNVVAENELWDCEPGTLAYFRTGASSIVFYYGNTRTITPGNTFAKIVDNWEAAYGVFRQAWYRNDIPIALELVDA